MTYMTIGQFEVHQRRTDTPVECHYVSGSLEGSKHKARMLSETDAGVAYVKDTTKPDARGHAKVVASFSWGRKR